MILGFIHDLCMKRKSADRIFTICDMQGRPRAHHLTNQDEPEINRIRKTTEKEKNKNITK